MFVRLIRKFPILLLASLAAGGAFGDSVMLMSSGDTDISESPPDNNNGGSTSFTSGANGRLERSRGLIRFDLAGQIPDNASIQAVSLTLVCTQVPGMAPADSLFDLHRLLVDWGEGSGFNPDNDFGRPALAGEATWNHRFYPATSWSIAGAAAPGDFSSAVSSSVLVQNVGAYIFPTSAAMVSDVKAWLANPAANFGWIVMSESENVIRTHRNFGSRENTTPGNQPILTVQYVIPVTPMIQSIVLNENGIQFIFQALGGQSYTAEYRDSLIMGDWAILSNISPQPLTTDVIVTDPAPPPTGRFYRVTTTF
jgi:hypothetical protein